MPAAAARRALTAAGEGPSGFSLEASLITRLSPYCLFTCSMERPGRYGSNLATSARGRRVVLSSIKDDTALISPRIASQDLEEPAVGLELLQRVLHVGVGQVALQ